MTTAAARWRPSRTNIQHKQTQTNTLHNPRSTTAKLDTRGPAQRFTEKGTSQDLSWDHLSNNELHTSPRISIRTAAVPPAAVSHQEGRK